MEGTDGLVRRAARWVLRATLGKSSDRGEPECFRPARTLREAPERGRLLLREPDAALLLGPRIGQRLGEAGDREICRAQSRRRTKRRAPSPVRADKRSALLFEA